MAIDSNALTLAEYALQSNDPLIEKITMSLHKTLNILQDIPFVTDNTMKMVGMRFVDNLPGVSWGQLNKAPVVTKGKPTPYEEQAMLIRNQFQVDKRYLNEKNRIDDPIATQVDAFMEGLTYELNYRFITNDPGDAVNGNADAIVGLFTRLNNTTTYGVQPEMFINAGAVDMSAAGMTTTTANQFIENVQQMLDYMNAPEGDGVVFYCNDLLKRRWERAVRIMGAGGGFDITRDAFDRPVATYKAAKIRDVGRRADQVTRIVTNTETNAGALGSSNYTSLYAVRYGDGYFKGWQTNPLKPDNLGIDPTNGIMYNIVVDWGLGLWQPHNRAICRQYAIKVS